MEKITGKPKIIYPCLWQYKVIGEDKERIREAIEQICAPVPVAITYSHCSSSGRYHSLNAEIEIQDEEARNALFSALQTHPDIMMVI